VLSPRGTSQSERTGSGSIGQPSLEPSKAVLALSSVSVVPVMGMKSSGDAGKASLPSKADVSSDESFEPVKELEKYRRAVRPGGKGSAEVISVEGRWVPDQGTG
jgi:hypothetical protein